jgi:hypothetical protein
MQTDTRAMAEHSRAGIEGPHKHRRIVVSTQVATPVTGSQTRIELSPFGFRRLSEAITRVAHGCPK